MTSTPDSAEAVNVRIAEMCGWKLVRFKCIATQYVGIHSPDGIRRGDVYDNPKDIALQWKLIAPNYSGSLDAMHEAEKTLTGSHEAPPTLEASAFYQELISVCYPKLAIFATAAQRAQAFITTKTRTNS